MRVLTADGMRAVDRRAIEEIGIPSLVLMENAAIGVADAIGGSFPDARAAALFCGPGNNGGDGVAVARHLVTRGYDVVIFLCFEGRRPTADCAAQVEIARALGLEVAEVADEADLVAAWERARAQDVIVDALFGTGLSRPLEGFFAAAAVGLGALGRPVVAVDVPSGLDASRARAIGPHVRADLTVTFAAPKVAHVLGDGSAATGRLAVTDLGVPDRLVDEVVEPDGPLLLVTREVAATWVSPRAAESHKGTYGHLLVVAGSAGKAGAAVLAARAAVRTGTGLVTAMVPAPLAPWVDLASLESMTLAAAADDLGRIALAAVDGVLAEARARDAVALGPGLGTEGEAAVAIRRIVLATDRPLVLDADGVNAFADRAEELRRRPAPTVLTPHPGELGRLLGRSTSEIVDDRLGAVREAARRTGCVVLLKGRRTLVAVPDGAVRINTTGNPGMATGGVGDVLTGVAGSLLAQGLDPFEAASLAAFVHGQAGDRAADRTGHAGLAAGDLLDELGPVLASLEGS